MPVASRSVLDVLRLSTDYLAQHGSSSPRLDAELLCAYAWGLRRLDLYLQHDRLLRDEDLRAARALVRRRANGEPVAYITGVREFYNRSFHVTPAVLIPRPETETLVEVALNRLRRRDVNALSHFRLADLGTGSGCIAVTLAAELSALHVLAVDSSVAALEVAHDNAGHNGVADRVTVIAGGWASSLADPLDLVVSNPPYVTIGELAEAEREVRDFEPRAALDGGADGLDAYRALIPSLNGRMQPASAVILEIDPRRAEAVGELMLATFPEAAVDVHRDLAGRDRVLEATLA